MPKNTRDDSDDDNSSSHSKKIKVKNEETDDNDHESSTTNSAHASSPKKNDTGESFFELSDKRRCTVRMWKGNIFVDIREFYEKNNKFLPGKKGISLTLDQYQTFRDLMIHDQIDSIVEQLQQDDGNEENNFFDLSSNSNRKRCTVRMFKKNILVDIREMYEKNGETLPGKKGISLSLEEYNTLKEIVTSKGIDVLVKQLGGKLNDDDTEQASSSLAKNDNADKDTTTTATSATATPPPANADSSVELETNEAGDYVFDLSNQKRCTVRSWKGKVLVDIREMYEKNGKVLPGKKGISLTIDQYKILSDLIKNESVDTAVKKLGGDM